MQSKIQPPHASAPLRVATTLLAAWIFVLSIAGVSPVIHSWLHADSGCAHECASGKETPSPHSDVDGHYCGVIALQSAAAFAPAIGLPERDDYTCIHFEPVHERLQAHAPETNLQARAPPIEILV